MIWNLLLWCAELCVTVAVDEVAPVLDGMAANSANITLLLRLLGVFEKYYLENYKQKALWLLDSYIKAEFNAFDCS
jgi:hypothetical protein